MIQDIYPSVFHNSFQNVTPDGSSKVLAFRKGELLVSYVEENQNLAYPVRNEFPKDVFLIYAFEIDDRKYFLTFEMDEPLPGYDFMDLRTMRKYALKDHTEIFAAYSGYHLYKWYESSRFCGRCGEKTKLDEAERAMHCPACGNKIYPRINPAVIVGVTNGNKLLLTKYRQGFGYNALIAGFTEFGETLEETVRREVMEEVGLKVNNIRYYKSQPWGIALDILTGFYCEVEGDDTIRMDESELKYAEWVERENIELQPWDHSLTNEMMKVFKEGKEADACAASFAGAIYFGRGS